VMHELLSPFLRVLSRATVFALIGGVYEPSAAPLLGVTVVSTGGGGRVGCCVVFWAMTGVASLVIRVCKHVSSCGAMS
jgi:hypothetical protein